MQLLLDIDEQYWDRIDEIDQDVINKKIKKDFRLEDNDSLKVVNIGPGADVMVILATIWTVGLAIMEFPTVLRDGLKNWKWLIDKIYGYLKKEQLVSVDMDGAFLLAIDYLAKEYGEDSEISVMDAHSFNMVDISGMFPNETSSFAAHPHNYYIFAFWINNKKVIISVRSTGKIRQLESFDDMPYGLKDSTD